MYILWQRTGTELTVRDVADELDKFAYTTVATVLDRLVHKELVQRRIDGRVIRFTAIGSRGAHTARLMHEALAIDDERDAALVEFADTLSRPELEVLRKALDARNSSTSISPSPGRMGTNLGPKSSLTASRDVPPC